MAGGGLLGCLRLRPAHALLPTGCVSHRRKRALCVNKLLPSGFGREVIKCSRHTFIFPLAFTFARNPKRCLVPAAAAAAAEVPRLISERGEPPEKVLSLRQVQVPHSD